MVPKTVAGTCLSLRTGVLLFGEQLAEQRHGLFCGRFAAAEVALVEPLEHLDGTEVAEGLGAVGGFDLAAGALDVHGGGQLVAHELRQVGHGHIEVDVDAEPRLVVEVSELGEVGQGDAVLQRADVDELATGRDRQRRDLRGLASVNLNEVDALLLIVVPRSRAGATTLSTPPS